MVSVVAGVQSWDFMTMEPDEEPVAGAAAGMVLTWRARYARASE